MISQSMDDKRNIILKVALELFVIHGFHATPTSQIATKAGVANGTLFHYFKTKEELINAVYLNTKDNFFIKITHNFEPGSEISKRFYTIWSNSINWAINNPLEFKFIQHYSNSPFISQLTFDQISRHIKFFYDQFEEGITNNVFKKLPIDLLHHIAMFQIYGFINYVFEYKDSANNKFIMELAFKSFWDSIKA